MPKLKRNSPLRVSLGLSGAVDKGLITYEEMAEAMESFFKYKIKDKVKNA